MVYILQSECYYITNQRTYHTVIEIINRIVRLQCVIALTDYIPLRIIYTANTTMLYGATIDSVISVVLKST